MSFKKQIYITITVPPYEVASGNMNDKLLNNLKKKLESKCYNGSFIQSVDKIIMRSSVVSNKELIDGSGTCDVCFEATCIQCDKYSIITLPYKMGQGNKLIFMTDDITACIDKSSIMNFTAGDILPIIVDMSRHMEFTSDVTVVGRPFTHPIKSLIFKLSTPETKDDVRETIKTQHEICMETFLKFSKTKTLSKIVNTLFRFKKDQPPIKGVESVDFLKGDLSDFEEITKKQGDEFYIAVYSGDKADTCRVYVFAKPMLTKFGDYNIITTENSAGVALMQLFSGFVERMRMVQNLTENFSTEAEFAKNKNVWELYESIKV